MKGYLSAQPLLRHVRRDEKQAAANVHRVLKRIEVNWEGKKTTHFSVCVSGCSFQPRACC